MMPVGVDRAWIRDGGLASEIQRLRSTMPTHDSNTLRLMGRRAGVNRAVAELERLRASDSAVSRYFDAQEALSEARASGSRSERRKAAQSVAESESAAVSEYASVVDVVTSMLPKPAASETSTINDPVRVGKW